MAHFAELDNNNVVLRVTVVNNEVLIDENNTEQEALGLKHLEHLGGRWVQTSYNNSFRKNYANIGYTYDSTRDAFIPPMPPTTIPDPENEGGTKEVSWNLNEDTCNWEIAY
jgi:hypothetical protein